MTQMYGSKLEPDVKTSSETRRNEIKIHQISNANGFHSRFVKTLCLPCIHVLYVVIQMILVTQC